MLEKVDLSKSMKDEDYKESMRTLTPGLRKLQIKAWELKIPIILVFEGWHASGVAEDINRFILPIDPRAYDFYTMTKPCREELKRPFLWRFWTKIPIKGRIVIFDRSWYSRALIEKARRDNSGHEFENCLEDINYFERQLADDGYLIIKFFIHISKKEQKKRFKEIQKKNIPFVLEEYGGQREELDFIHEYDNYLPLVEKALEKTESPHAPWTIVEAENHNFATIKIITTFMQAVEARIKKITGTSASQASPSIRQNAVFTDTGNPIIPELTGSPLEKADLSKALAPDEYTRLKKLYRDRIRDIQYELFRHNRSMVIVFEGWDAAGKGSAIQRLIGELNPRLYRVVPVGSPNEFEKAHNYLWRFYEGVPKTGHITIYDRSWYGRVLVERVEGFCTPEEWKRAYREINEFEEILAKSGAIIIKFWLHIDPDVQLKRFESRQNDPDKQWKITPEDWRNRSKWNEYKDAVDEMLQKTSTTYSPWTIVEANDKYFARVKVLRSVLETLERELKL